MLQVLNLQKEKILVKPDILELKLVVYQNLHVVLNALICTISENSNNPTKWGEYHQSHFVAEVRMVTCPKSQNSWTPKKCSKPLHCIAPSQKCLLYCKEILKAHSLLLFQLQLVKKNVTSVFQMFLYVNVTAEINIIF